MDRREQIERAVEREEDQLQDDFASGAISREQYNAQYRALQRDACAEMEEEDDRYMRERYGY